VCPGEAVVFEQRVYFMGWVEGHFAALTYDPHPHLDETAPPATRPLVDLLALPEELSRARSDNSNYRLPSNFPEFADEMDNILKDIHGLAGFAPWVMQTRDLAFNVVRTIETRTFHALRLLHDYERSQAPTPSPPRTPKSASRPRAA
jgi:hypothetical protein